MTRHYEDDDGPLTDEQLEAIRKTADTNIPESILFRENTEEKHMSENTIWNEDLFKNKVVTDNSKLAEWFADQFMKAEIPKGVVSDTCMTDPDYNYPRYGTNIMDKETAIKIFTIILGTMDSIVQSYTEEKIND